MSGKGGIQTLLFTGCVTLSQVFNSPLTHMGMEARIAPSSHGLLHCFFKSQLRCLEEGLSIAKYSINTIIFVVAVLLLCDCCKLLAGKGQTAHSQCQQRYIFNKLFSIMAIDERRMREENTK